MAGDYTTTPLSKQRPKRNFVGYIHFRKVVRDIPSAEAARVILRGYRAAALVSCVLLLHGVVPFLFCFDTIYRQQPCQIGSIPYKTHAAPQSASLYLCDATSIPSSSSWAILVSIPHLPLLPPPRLPPLLPPLPPLLPPLPPLLPPLLPPPRPPPPRPPPRHNQHRQTNSHQPQIR